MSFRTECNVILNGVKNLFVRLFASLRVAYFNKLIYFNKMLCTPERPNPGNLKQQSFSDNSESVHKYEEMKQAVALFFPVRPGLRRE